MIPRIYTRTITFSGGTTLNFDNNDVVVVVGPNNAGKSVALRAIRDKLADINNASPVISSIRYESAGTGSEVYQWLQSMTKLEATSTPGNPRLQGLGAAVFQSEVESCWNSLSPSGLRGFTKGLRGMTRFFCYRLTAEERLQGANPPQNISLTDQAPIHPIHFLQQDDSLEKRLSEQFRKAFGVDLIVHRNAGDKVPLYVGQRPEVKPGQDRVSREYNVELEKLPKLETQGDGMRSFASVLLYTSVGQESVLLIDEPEAFLHPPQARLLGRMLISDAGSERQLFVATHSGDVLRGVLDGNSKRTRVVRIRRDGNVNQVRELDHENIQRLWADPLLRYSDILNGLFHERVVVCEGDSDARFYAAVMDALYEGSRSEQQKPAIMFTHCGGKGRLHMVVSSLRALDVPVIAVVDFDILRDENPLSGLVVAAGGNWETLKGDWRIVKSSIDKKNPDLKFAEVKQQISEILDKVLTVTLPDGAKQQIKKLLKRTSAWANAKAGGKSFVPSGEPTQACSRLLKDLRHLGIFVVECGELEGFARTIGTHGPSWVNEVLTRDLNTDPELDRARQFVEELIT